MRKRRSLLIVAMVIAATAATLFVGCKKEKNEAATNADRSEAQALLNRIEAFQTLRDAVNSGAKADGSMTVEEMRQALDLVSNYEHSEHMTYCLNTTLDTLHVTMPAVDGEGYVSNADVVATYNAFETALEKCMLGVNDGMDVPRYFSIVIPKEGTKDDCDIDVIFRRGSVSDDNDNTSTVEFDAVKWGLNLGFCNLVGPYLTPIDASDLLTRDFTFTPDPQHEGQYYFVHSVEYAQYAPAEELLPDDIIFYENPNIDSCVPTWLFLYYGEVYGNIEEPCISYEEYLCYRNNSYITFVPHDAPLHFGPNLHSPFHECAFTDRIDQRQCRRMHIAQPMYCYIVWEEQPLPPLY